jgi:hypothetical protein
MTDPTDKRIEELWQYIPPYTTPNYPPPVEVITTTNTGDTPMTEDPDLLAGDNLDRLRDRNPHTAMSERFRLWEELENAKYQNNLLAQRCRELEQERDEARRRACRDEALIRLERGRVHRDSEEVVRMAKEISVERGWDCFKENTDGK